MAKIKSTPERFLADLILEKQFRGMDGYAAQSRIPAMKLARAKLKKDAQDQILKFNDIEKEMKILP